MAEKAQAKTAEKNTEKKTKENKTDKKTTDTVVSGKNTPAAKVFEAKWTLERCKRYARRFANEATWASCAPASYKAACAHGWRDACVNQTTTTTNKTPKRAA